MRRRPAPDSTPTAGDAAAPRESKQATDGRPLAPSRAGPERRTPAHAAQPVGAVTTLVDALRAVNRALRVAQGDGNGGGLPPAQTQVLRVLARGPASALAELAARTHTDPSSASVVVQRLVELGLVVRRPAAEDRRRVELALTAAGRARLRAVPATAENRLAAALACLPSPDVAALTRGLRQLAAALGEASPAAEPPGESMHRPRGRRGAAKR